MGEIAVSNEVLLRDGFGRFIRECEDAGKQTIQDAVDKGYALSMQMAPESGQADPRSVSIKGGMWKEASGTRGRWGTLARHGMAVELGTRRHPQTGNVSFFWAKEGREWEPGDNMIDHPATRAQPFLKPAYRAVMKQVMAIMRKNYP
jgi:hypothetical protein